MTDQKHVEEFLKDNTIGVVSTSGVLGIQSAALYFIADKDLGIYFNTHTDSEKFKNIENNPSVSFVVFQKNPAVTLQIKGEAEVLRDIGDIKEIYNNLLYRTIEGGEVPPLHKTQGEIALIKITPFWARFGDFSKPEKEFLILKNS